MDCGFCLFDARAGTWCGGRDGFERKWGGGGGGGMVVRLRKGGRNVGNYLVEWFGGVVFGRWELRAGVNVGAAWRCSVFASAGTG